jgi:N,N'-diacetyllegionaminate synthase
LKTEITIDNRPVGDGHPVFIIGEIGLAHDGSLGTAHAYIEHLATVGVDAVKFQTHIAEAESSKYEDFRVNVFPQDKTRPDYWRRTAFSKPQWVELADHARDAGLIFMSSPFSHEAVDLLMECGTPAWKVASGEVTNLPLLKHMASTGLPILVSSGMSTWNELNNTIEFLEHLNTDYGIFQCTTSYPCPPEQWGLNIITEMLEKFNCPVGLSDHSGTIFPSLAAKQLGASMIECHVVFDREQFGPDSKASLTFDDFSLLVEGIRALEIAETSPINKDDFARLASNNRMLFSKSLFAAHDLVAGTKLSISDIQILKPLLGVPAKQYDEILGKTLKQDISKGEPISFDAIDEA